MLPVRDPAQKQSFWARVPFQLRLPLKGALGGNVILFGSGGGGVEDVYGALCVAGVAERVISTGIEMHWQLKKNNF